MEPFTRLTAVAAPFDVPDLDTERIVPARFLRKPRSAGYEHFLFFDLRRTAGGDHDPAFILNREPFDRAGVLVAAENFGCGSSREGAVWALAGAGFRAIIAPSFGDIFLENCLKNGVLALTLPAAVVTPLRAALHARPGAQVTIDLERGTVTAPAGTMHPFTIDEFRRQCLLAGRDELELTLGHREVFEAWEQRRHAGAAWARPTPPAPAGGPRA